MTNNSYLDIANPRLFQLIEQGNQINKSIIRLLSLLSNFILGVFVIILLVPITIILVTFTTIISRLTLEYLYHKLKREELNIPDADERGLMENLIHIDYFIRSMEGIQIESKSTNSKTIYYNLFFGSSLNKTLLIQNKLKAVIEEKVYPDLNKELDEEQINRLLKSFEGLELIED